MDASIAPLPVDVGAERAIVVAVAAASIILATFAAWIQDDLEHVVGYSIVGDAGVVMLAFAALDPAAWTPGRIWILAFVVTRSAFAAWAAVVRDSFGTSRLPDLRGWGFRSPLLVAASRDDHHRLGRPPGVRGLRRSLGAGGARARRPAPDDRA